jgi:hypothetical protein
LGTSAQVGRYLYSEILSEGDEVELVARPINIGNIATAIDCTVDGFVQAFEHTRPTDSTAMRTVRIVLTVPELDRYGEVQ